MFVQFFLFALQKQSCDGSDDIDDAMSSPSGTIGMLKSAGGLE